MRTLTGAVTVLLLWGVCRAEVGASSGVEPAEGAAVRVAQPPVVDGRLDDAAWDAAIPLQSYVLLGSSARQPAAGTWTKVIWTATTLYLGTSCEEPFPERLRAEVSGYDDAVYNDDSVEIFLDPEGAGVGFAQLDVNSRGVRFDTRQYGTHYQRTWYATAGATQVDWRPEWTAQARVEPGHWTVEVAIPFDALGGTPQVGDTWGANFTRQRYAEPELSTWTPLAGETFLQPHSFGRLTFRGAPPPAPQVVRRDAGHAPNPLPLVPRPRQLEPQKGSLSLGAVIRLQPRDAEAARYVAGCAALLPGAQVLLDRAPVAGAVQLATLGADGQAPLADVPDLAGRLEPVREAQGYALLVTGSAAAVVGADAAGVRNGLMTLSQLVQRTASGYAVPRVRIRDWPAASVRAWHVGLPGADDDQAYATWVDALARLKYNTLMIEVDGSFPYESHPEIGRARAPAKEQVRRWVTYARERGFEVIPQVAVFGHLNWVLDRPGWADLAENPEAGGEVGRWVANVRDPRYFPLIFDLFQEVIDVFQPTVFHIGHDEITFQPIGVHPMTRSIPPAQLLAEEVTRLHDWLAERRLQTMMWGDQLLAEDNGGSPYFTAAAIDRIPQDIIIDDWHYDPNERFPSVAFFRRHGFPVIGCGWWQPLNIWNLARVSAAEQALGFSGTSWWELADFPHSAEHQVAFVLGAESAWNPTGREIDALGYRPGTVWRHLAGWDAPAIETEYTPIDLSCCANRSLADSEARGGWLGLGPEHDLRRLPRGLQWWDGVPYRVAEAAPEALVLAAAGDPPRRAPRSVRGIPVGTCARALYFLQTCSAPASRSSDIYTRAAEYPRHLGRWVVTYEDGSTADVPIDYRQTLTDWNDGEPPAQASVVWSGADAGGAYVALSAFRWDNPHPDKPIRRLDVQSEDATLRIAVLAVTAALR
ncbi:MAG: glycoside hydrolase family 20 zincin-like fold domain-containing protein [Candidatus Latescibacterota bacterium]|jgi:hypothetical protein